TSAIAGPAKPFSAFSAVLTPNAAATIAAPATRAARAMIIRLIAVTTPTQVGSIRKPLLAAVMLSTGSARRVPRRRRRSAESLPVSLPALPAPGRNRQPTPLRRHPVVRSNGRTPAAGRRAASARPDRLDRARSAPSPTGPPRAAPQGPARPERPRHSSAAAGPRRAAGTAHTAELPHASATRRPRDVPGLARSS